jgi:hypothetical protein
MQLMQVLTAASSLDIRKHFCVITAINRDGENAFGPDRVEHEDLEARLKKSIVQRPCRDRIRHQRLAGLRPARAAGGQGVGRQPITG